jgi:hypothetical protein
MSTDLLSEDRLSLNQLAHQVGVSLPTAWRWTRRGIRGTRLESVAVGGRRYTSTQAFRRFVAATNESIGTSASAGTTAHRQSAIARAEQEFERARA